MTTKIYKEFVDTVVKTFEKHGFSLVSIYYSGPIFCDISFVKDCIVYGFTTTFEVGGLISCILGFIIPISLEYPLAITRNLLLKIDISYITNLNLLSTLLDYCITNLLHVQKEFAYEIVKLRLKKLKVRDSEFVETEKSKIISLFKGKYFPKFVKILGQTMEDLKKLVENVLKTKVLVRKIDYLHATQVVLKTGEKLVAIIETTYKDIKITKAPMDYAPKTLITSKTMINKELFKYVLLGMFFEIVKQS